MRVFVWDFFFFLLQFPNAVAANWPHTNTWGYSLLLLLFNVLDWMWNSFRMFVTYFNGWCWFCRSYGRWYNQYCRCTEKERECKYYSHTRGCSQSPITYGIDLMLYSSTSTCKRIHSPHLYAPYHYLHYAFAAVFIHSAVILVCVCVLNLLLQIVCNSAKIRIIMIPIALNIAFRYIYIFFFLLLLLCSSTILPCSRFRQMNISVLPYRLFFVVVLLLVSIASLHAMFR